MVKSIAKSFFSFGLLSVMVVLCRPAYSADNGATLVFADGFELIKSGKFQAAVTKFEAGLKSDPTNAKAHFYLGDAYLGLKKNDKAKAQYQAVLRLEPTGDIAQDAKSRLAQLSDAGSPAAAKPEKSVTSSENTDSDKAIPLLENTKLRWGMSADEAIKAGAKRYSHFNIPNQETIGFPYRELADVGFEVSLDFDEQKDWRPTFGPGLQMVVFSLWGECREADYRRLKTQLSRFEAIKPEQISGETEWKDRLIIFYTKGSVITLFSRCDNPFEKYRHLTLRIEAPATKK